MSVCVEKRTLIDKKRKQIRKIDTREEETLGILLVKQKIQKVNNKLKNKHEEGYIYLFLKGN